MSTLTDGLPAAPSEADPYKLPEALFDLGEGGLAEAKRDQAIDVLTAFLQDSTKNFLGYQVNECLRDEGRELTAFLQMHTNNIGDPFKDATLRSHTKPLERAVLAYFADLWGLDPYKENDLKTAWGYVLTMGSSEGNVYALMSARDYLSGITVMHPHAVGLAASPGTPELILTREEPPEGKENYYKPVVFFSEDAHYSVAKAAHILRIPTFGEVGNTQYRGQFPPPDWPLEVPPIAMELPWPVEVPSQGGADGPGSINIDALISLVRFFADKGHPLLFVLNLGSTFKGAYDDVHKITELIRPILEEYHLDNRPVGDKDDRRGYWVHVDGALGASYVPFLREAQGIDTTKVPAFDFTIPEVTSIVTSGHKYPGCPWPCGIYMTRQEFQIQPPPTPDYISAPDTTFGGSRNAFSSIFLWDWVARHDRDAQRKMIASCTDMVSTLMKMLAPVDKKLTDGGKDGLFLQHTPDSLCIRFRKPNPPIVSKYSLASVTVAAGKDDEGIDQVMDYTHVYVMPHVTTERAQDLIDDLMKDGAFPDRARKPAEHKGVADEDVMHPGDAGVIAKFAMNRGLI